MAGISNTIEEFLKQLLEDSTNIEVQRNELAKYFNCAPSQINYVLQTRFSLEHGYVIESKRGGGGCILITQIDANENEVLRLIQNQVEQTISQQRGKNIIKGLFERKYLTKREAKLLIIAMEQLAIVPENIRDYVRANILRETLTILLIEKKPTSC